ncbi:MAG TPA: 1-acyl-sn-glycerol-3-phosphate acyltransferase [Clostridia bacterium]|nr:1-acyl-sn-glycerol-3-phosphate acyltransferase [Clostridia bacterium]
MKTALKKANLPLYFVLYYVISAYYSIVNRISYDNEATKGLHGPAIVLSTHPNYFDFIHVAMALYPRRITIMANRMYCDSKSLSSLLRSLCVIPKRLFYADAESIHKLYAAVKSNHIVVMMPEGRLSSCGSNFPVARGTARLIKRLRVPVYRCNANGAYFVRPKWSPISRAGNIRLETKKILDANDIEAMSESEIELALSEAMSYENDCLGNLRVCKDRTLGLDGLLFVCPECGKEFTLTTKDNHVHCDSCGFDAVMQKDCTFDRGDFKHLREWYAFQQDYIDQQANNLKLSAKVRVSVCLDKLTEAGEGVMSLDCEGFRFNGKLFGEDTDFFIPAADLAGMPFDCGKSVETYHNDLLYFFYPVENPRQCVKWSMLVDSLEKTRRKS